VRGQMDLKDQIRAVVTRTAVNVEEIFDQRLRPQSAEARSGARHRPLLRSEPPLQGAGEYTSESVKREPGEVQL
jgi:hypothetical protein